MKFYSGFSLKDDLLFFKEFINRSEYTTCGFSYGAIKAFEDTYTSVMNGERVDSLQLFSPAFFQTKSDKFKKMQVLGFSRNQSRYLEQFTASCFSPYTECSLTHSEATKEGLEELLNYEWSFDKLQELQERGVKIEVYLGGSDIVIDVKSAREFFLQLSSVTYIKNANHFLQTE